MRNELVRLEEEQPAAAAGERGVQHPWERSEDTGDTGAKAVEGEEVKAEEEEAGFGLLDAFMGVKRKLMFKWIFSFLLLFIIMIPVQVYSEEKAQSELST